MSTRITTTIDLANKIDDEFSWRRKELTLIKSKIPTEINSWQSAMIRTSIPILYAHWEGFIKLAMSYYLEFVSNKYLKHNELNSKFIALSLQNKIGELNINSFGTKVKTIDFLFSEFSKRSNIPKKNIINTKSNLSFDVLKEILFILDLDDKHFDSQKDLIDSLVDVRNHIAHGEYKLMDYKTCLEFFVDIISLMEYVKTVIENNALLQKYKVPTRTSPS